MSVIPKSKLAELSAIPGHVQGGNHLSHLSCTFPTESRRGHVLPPCFGCIRDKRSFRGLLSSVFCTSVHSVGDFAVSNIPKRHAAEPCNASQCSRAVLCLTETAHAFARLCLGQRRSAAGHGFSVRESTTGQGIK